MPPAKHVAGAGLSKHVGQPVTMISDTLTARFRRRVPIFMMPSHCPLFQLGCYALSPYFLTKLIEKAMARVPSRWTRPVLLLFLYED